ncbi:DUF2846 domain-containing protein [Pseudoalteromonas sp. R3]|uniref:DUF2846 domain-containing protein n=1 Tax=Pseudoalteromonas sp. R3 TaxID=1709477 RepID=UPI0006B45680|nr:DUF2846 domain-containing protein [Pseudoalteromonas sp. R3]AZZ98379.1 DUF2846 domain-containing protein [Pseudoalteromonas sp. R3]
MYKKIAFTAVLVSLFSGCASVPLESEEASSRAKQYEAPKDGYAGLYIYRDSSIGGALKKDIWVNDECVGESAPNVFFYKQVEAGKGTKITTESEFSPNDLIIDTESGKNYYIEQYIKLGVFVGGANLKQVSEGEGQEDITPLKLAKPGKCSKK